MTKRYYDDHEMAYVGIRNRGEVGWQAKTEFRDPTTEAPIRRLVAKHFLSTEGKSALDIGCGTGPTAHMSYELGFRTTGIDVSPTAIELARERASRESREIEFVSGDVMAFLESGRNFDFVYDSHCLHCIVLDEDRSRLYRGIFESLTESGRFILDTMAFRATADICAKPEPLRFDEEFILWHRTKTRYEGVEEFEGELWCPQRRIYPVETLLSELESVGFTILEHEVEDQGPDQPFMLRVVCSGKTGGACEIRTHGRG